MAEDRVVGRAGMRQRAGMRGGGAAAGVGAPDLRDDDRLAGARRLVGDGAEAGGVANAFEIAHENIGAAGVEHPIDIIVRFEHGLIAGADLIGELQLAVAAARQKRIGQRARLAGDRDRPGAAAFRQERHGVVVEHRAERRDQRAQRVDEALRVRPGDDHAGALCDIAQRRVARRRFLAFLLAKTGADHDRRLDAARAALLDRRNDMRRRHQDHREIGRLRYFRDRGVGRVPEHLLLAAGYRIDAAGIGVLDELFRQPAAQRVVGRRADNDDAVRREEGAEIGHSNDSVLNRNI